ncbi:hypothetical protein [Pseudomonas sp. I3-I5]|uniref:hypothetical protein n=1 Tax=Pseudomonas sp. I3-I5 TaxID=2926671 RepID=UPI001F600665|nr:hypothetical protein [Pseudomonas sp. I3-I5]UNT14722.1 hypothetical protein MOP87_05790 [Pseudomonas sp. I3-I5]
MDNYRVFSGATLNATGANLLYVDAEAGAHVLLNDSDVTPGSSAVALALTGANATLERSTVTASSRALTGSQGASISANDSVIRGGSRGASLNQSHLELRRSEVHASDNNGVAVELFDGSVSASDSSLISGGRDGILVRDGSGQTDAKATIVLDNSRVEGLDGSAIAVGHRGRPWRRSRCFCANRCAQRQHPQRQQRRVGECGRCCNGEPAPE